jgi:hypothetical protein
VKAKRWNKSGVDEKKLKDKMEERRREKTRYGRFVLIVQ